MAQGAGGAFPVNAAPPPHLEAAQLLIGRCPTPERRKEFIIAAHCAGAIGTEDAELLIQANQLETA
jgi:hypothetical protein